MIRVGLTVLLLSLAAVSDTAPGAPPAGGGGLVLLLASDAPSYAARAPARFTVAVDNPGQTPVAVAFPSAQVYDIAVFDEQRELWRWSAERAFADVETERSFPPGVTLLGRETWETRDAGGAPLPPGTYRAVANLATRPPRQQGNAVQITLAGGP